MAQRVTGINVRRRRAATKKQREEEARNEIRKLTGQLDVLRGRLTEVTEQREAMTLPNLEGKKVEHSKYGEGTVSEQKDTVLTITYAGGVRKQKLPFVIASGCVTVDDSEATERCRRINDLETEQSKLKNSDDFVLQKSRQEIAESFAIQKFSLQRCLKEFAADGMIQTNGKQIIILDREKLMAVAKMTEK